MQQISCTTVWSVRIICEIYVFAKGFERIMNGRKPTVAEKLYIEAVKSQVGCLACDLLDYDNDAPVEYIAFHHDPDHGSSKPGAHFFGYPLCAVHHQGVTPSGMPIPTGEPVRHPQLGQSGFSKKLGSDADLCAIAWSKLSERAKSEIERAGGVSGYEDLTDRFAE